MVSFFFDPSLTSVWRLAPPIPKAPPELVVGPCGSSLDADLDFFLSDLIGELEPKDRGLLLEPSGLLEESDFLEEKNLPLNTIVTVSIGV